MKRTLKLEKRGIDFIEHDKIALESNCENYRLRAKHIVTKEGYILHIVDFIAGFRFEYYFKNGKPRKKPKLIKKYHLYIEASYYLFDEKYGFITKGYGTIENEARKNCYLYTLENILKCINTIAKVPYTDIKII